MNDNELERKKQVIGLYGEMQLAMALHEKGWQVHRAYIDEGIDFTITKYWCAKCQKYSNQLIRVKKYHGTPKKCVTNLCEICKTSELSIISRYLQIKTSEGIETADSNIRKFSFHPKIRYDMGYNVLNIWTAILNNDEINKICHFYIFNTKDLILFDDVNIDTYQITDNQKTTLTIDKSGKVLNKGLKYDYSCINSKFFNNFSALD